MEATTTRRTPVRKSKEERRALLTHARTMHLKHVQTIENKLAMLEGKVTDATARSTMKQWLEGITTSHLKSHALGLNIDDPSAYDDLDVLIETILSKTFGEK